MADHNTKEGIFRRRSGGAVIGALTASFFLPPLIAFGSPVLWGLGGAAIGITLLGLYNLAVLPTGQVDPKMNTIVWVFGIIALALLVYTFVDSSLNSYAFDQRCRSLQTEMLEGIQLAGETVKPDNAHDAYDALGCRPQFN